MVDLKERQELGWLLGATAGRVLGVPAALVRGQEQAGQMLAGSKKEDHEAVVRDLERKYPEELRHTAVRLGGSHTWDDLKRIWRNPRVGLLMRMLGTVYTPFRNLSGDLFRDNRYNPFADTVTVYGNVPAITAHELGRAVDFNRRRFEAPIFDRAARSAYHLGLGLSQSGPVPLPSPLPTLAEIRAASRAVESASDVEGRSERRRWSWPAVGTRLALAGLGAGLFLAPERTLAAVNAASSATRDVLRRLGASSLPAHVLAPPLVATGALGLSALAARALAGVVSARERRQAAEAEQRKKKDATPPRGEAGLRDS